MRSGRFPYFQKCDKSANKKAGHGSLQGARGEGPGSEIFRWNCCKTFSATNLFLVEGQVH